MPDTEKMLEDIDEQVENLTEWEIGFIDNVRMFHKGSRGLTEKQQDALQNIWQRLMGG